MLRKQQEKAGETANSRGRASDVNSDFGQKAQSAVRNTSIPATNQGAQLTNQAKVGPFSPAQNSSSKAENMASPTT